MPRLSCRLITLLLILASAAAAVPATASEFWSIDCGGTDPSFTDANNLVWTNDSLLAPHGFGTRSSVARGTTVAWLPTGPIPLPKELSTLRAFPSISSRRHCYTLPDIGLGRKILLRTTFFYGNYDGRSTPPTFQVILETEPWSMVAATMENVVTLEVVYTTTRKDVRVCLGRVYPDQDPFINSIEVRALPAGMYAAANSSARMWTLRRNHFGADATIRYPYDSYDRMWRRARTSEGGSYPSVPNSAPGVDASSAGPDDPPERVFERAAVPNDTSIDGMFNISTSNLPPDPIPIYLNLYFTEPLNLSGTGMSRAFYLFQDGTVALTADAIVPPYGQVIELVYSGLHASSATVFSLVPAALSYNPPVISALELFWVTYGVTLTTDINDVRALTKLQSWFPVLQKWTGDPCLPHDYAWEWVGCSSASPPRITNLLLGGLGLSGSIPDFSSLDALMTIDLHNNNFSGAIPVFLANFTHLKFLNLADNNFTSIPDSWSQRESSVTLKYISTPPEDLRIFPILHRLITEI